MLDFRDNDFYLGKDGYWYFRLTTPMSKRRTGVCTYERTRRGAAFMVRATGIDRLEHLAKAQAVTDEAIAIVTKGAIVTTSDAYALWLDWVTPQIAPQTREQYSMAVERMMKYLDCADRAMNAITEQELSDYIHSAARGGRPRGAKAIGERKICLKSFFKYASAKGFVRGNPLSLVVIRYNEMTVAQLTPKVIGPFTEDEYNRMREASRLEEFTGYGSDFWHEAIVLGYCCGFRISDCCCLQRASLRPDGITIFPKKSNTNIPLGLPFSDPLINRPELIELNARLIATIPASQTYCWPDRQRQYTSSVRMERIDIAFEFPRIAKEAGIDRKGRGFHSLRRSFACRLRAAGYSIDQVKERMGHTDANMTRRYTGEEPVDFWGQFRNPPRKDWGTPADTPTVAAEVAAPAADDPESELAG